jgi:hypothetical protein
MHFNDRDRREEISERMAADAFADQDLPLGAPRRGSVSDETWRRCVDIVKGDALQRWQIAAKTFEVETRERGRQKIIDAAEKLQRERDFLDGIWGVRARSDHGTRFDTLSHEERLRLAEELAENWRTDR